MKSYRVLLVCSGGMSTSVLMRKMEDYAKETGVELKIDARGTGDYQDVADNYDVILLGPQIAYRKAQIAGTVKIPVETIAPQDYAFGNAAKILEAVDKILS